MKLAIAAWILFSSTFISLLAQTPSVQVNRENRTIAVTADESVEAKAEIAILRMGFHNFAPTKDAAYAENVQTTNSILQALTRAGVEKEEIQTETFSLTRQEVEEDRTTRVRTVRFEARQMWRVRCPVPVAQQLMDVAVKAGANDLSDTEWTVADSMALQARAGAAALTKARQIAEQMAKGLNAKLGPLVYASNQAPATNYYSVDGNRPLNGRSFQNLIELSSEKHDLLLFPQKVKSQATVYAVFAID